MCIHFTHTFANDMKQYNYFYFKYTVLFRPFSLRMQTLVYWTFITLTYISGWKSESWGQRWQEVIFYASWNKNVNAKYTKLHFIYKITKNTFTELFCRIFKSLYYIPNIWRCNYLNEERKMTTNISDQDKQRFVSSDVLQSSLTKLEIQINMWPS